MSLSASSTSLSPMYAILECFSLGVIQFISPLCLNSSASSGMLKLTGIPCMFPELEVVMVLMSGFFDRFPRLRAGVFEASSTWLSFLLDECDKYYKLYRNERDLPPLSCLPSEAFHECYACRGSQLERARSATYTRGPIAATRQV